MSSVHAAIAARFAAPEWATFYEVSNDAGFNRSRSADAIAMNLWPSRGLALHGIEVKVSRSDWLRELKDPAKAEPIQRFCDRWWVAVSDDSIVREGELPATWGLLVLRKDKLVSAKEAPSLTAAPLERGFIAALLRRASESSVPKSVIDATVAKRVEENVERQMSNLEMGKKSLEDRLRTTEKTISDFEAAAGVRLVDWRDDHRAEVVGKALRFVVDGGLKAERRRLEDLRARARGIADNADEALRCLSADESEVAS